MPILLARLMVLALIAGPPVLEPLGHFDARAIPEASGIVKSRRFPGIFWVHNDSGNRPELFAVKSDGRIVRRFPLAIPNLDWEDIAIDDQGHLYLGDIGNNTGLLRVRTIYRLDEPDPTRLEDKERDRPVAATRTVHYVLPESNRFDAESLVYDRGTAILIAKYLDGRAAELFAVAIDPPSSQSPKRAEPVRLIGKLPAFKEPATGADLSEDGTLLAVCSYAVTRVYRRSESPRWRLLAEVRYETVPIEGITWDGGDLILAAEESRGLSRLTEATWRAAGVARETRPDDATRKAR